MVVAEADQLWEGEEGKKTRARLEAVREMTGASGETTRNSSETFTSHNTPGIRRADRRSPARMSARLCMPRYILELLTNNTQAEVTRTGREAGRGNFSPVR